METEIINKTYNKPREMFDDACLLIANQLEEYGFKYSKSQASIKKKDKLLTYKMKFCSSHYNYICEDKGHVVMEFFCVIEYKGDIIFLINQKDLRSEMHRFEIFDNETKKIDLKQIEKIEEFINNHFLPVVFAIQTDTNSFLENMANQPIARYDDYGFEYKSKFFEIFNREDLIEKYENKIEEFNNNQAVDNRKRFRKYLLPIFGKIKLEEFDINDLWTILQKSWSSTNFTKFKKPCYEDYNKEFERLSKMNISDKADWLIDYYIILIFCNNYIGDENLKEQALHIIKKFQTAFR